MVSETGILCHFVPVLLSSILIKQLTCNVGIISLNVLDIGLGYLVDVTCSRSKELMLVLFFT